MSNEQMQENTTPEGQNLLQSRPQRRSRRGPATLLLLVGALVIVGVVAIIAWQTFSPGSSAPRTGTNTPASGKGQNSSATPPGWNDPAIYWQTIREQVAQSLHLTVAQVTAQLQAAGAATTATPSSNGKGNAPDPGAPMTTVAAQQGISTAQLRTIELNALHKGCDALVAQGTLTQAQADQRMQTFDSWDQGTLNWYVTHAFTGQ
jgi:hypothetical protein